MTRIDTPVLEAIMPELVAIASRMMQRNQPVRNPLAFTKASV